MRSPDLGQIVVDPNDASDELLAAINLAISGDQEVEISRRTQIRLLLADILHPIGIHHWVHYRTFDPVSARIFVWPNYWVCAKCPKGRIR